MEGNFYVIDNPVKHDANGKLATAFRKCETEASLYGKCVELRHANKDLHKNACVQERVALRKCIDKHTALQREALKSSASTDSSASSSASTATKLDEPKK